MFNFHLLRHHTAQTAAHFGRITASERNALNDAHLGQTLCFVAGAVNAGGFLAVGQYTSHMSGIVSAMADAVALGSLGIVTGGLAAVAAFIGGAACSAILINWARRHDPRNQFAYPLLLEAMFLLSFGVFSGFEQKLFLVIPLLCFIMGLQNAIITKVSQARMRTTHITGVVTDIGIELGKFAYWNRDPALGPVTGDRSKLKLLTSLLLAFIVGGIAGALIFKAYGFLMTIPLAAILLLLAGLPMAARVLANRR